MKNKIIVLVVAALILIGAVFLLTGQKNSTSPVKTTIKNNVSQVEGTTITVTKEGYSPKSITIKTGTRVVWFNQTGGTTSVYSGVHPTNNVYPPLNLGRFNDGAEVWLTFDKPGTYRYYNNIDLTQTGVIIVE